MTQAGWGGDWTRTKLAILRAYLDAYTTALKDQPFKLRYIDAFAGTGTIELGEQDIEGRRFLDGSARIALEIRNRPFDELIFVEKEVERARALQRLEHLASQDVVIRHGDANEEVRRICESADWRAARAIAFIDPFATQTDWATVAAIADTRAIDTWILFPIQAIRRMLPRDALPESISPDWASHLTRVFGDESWRQLYTPSAQMPLFENDRDDSGLQTDRGVNGIVRLYREKLETIYPHVAPQSRRLFNSQGSPLFEFMFAAGNPRGGSIAVRIATHLILRTL